MEVKARDVYGKKVLFTHEGVDKTGTVYGLDKVLSDEYGVDNGVVDIYHVIVKGRIEDELFELKLESIKFLDNDEKRSEKRG